MNDIRYREAIQHGTAFFPFHCYEMKGQSKQQMVGIHWHEEVEWLYVEKGSLQLQVDEEFYMLQEGDLFMVPSQCIHQLFAKEKCHYFAFVFDFHFLNFEVYDRVGSKYLSPLLKGECKIGKVSNIHMWKEGKAVIENIIEATTSKPIAWEVQVKAALLSLITLCYQHHYIEFSSQDEGNHVMKEVYSYLHEHYHQKVYLHELAKHVHLNEQYLCRYVKSVSGKTIVEYLNQYRIEQACAMLEETKESVMEVAFQCGFENISYFISRFKQIKKMTPLAYRKHKKEVDQLM